MSLLPLRSSSLITSYEWCRLRRNYYSPLQVAVVVHVAMTAYQSVIYDWVKATGTLRLSPFDPRIGKSHRYNFAALNNKCMELRKVKTRTAVLPPSLKASFASTSCASHLLHVQVHAQTCQ